MTPIRYVIHPGTVVSRSDGDIHYISGAQLRRLYDVRPGDWWVEESRGWPVQALPNDVHLYPLFEGGYASVHKESETW